MAKKKEAFIQIRIGEEEKKKIRQEAKRSGFDTISAYVLWLLRRSRNI